MWFILFTKMLEKITKDCRKGLQWLKREGLEKVMLINLTPLAMVPARDFFIPGNHPWGRLNTAVKPDAYQ